ncbi:hypothetical protein OG474_44155 [Kribbella sp. NBC_01505]|uniref:hypothetical protein n=1 Tax=Kribbella sp. NBC_01505 TaxID=2903580 RepID=UPI003866AA11
MAFDLLVGGSACGGDDKALAPAEQATPTPSTPKPSPTPVDPTVAAKAKIMADYKVFIDTQSEGFVSNSPSFPFERVMTGEALASARLLMGGSQLAGTKYGGSLRFLTGEVSEVNLEAKPATATVVGCIVDGLTATSKKWTVPASVDHRE